MRTLVVLLLFVSGCGFHPHPHTPKTWYDERWGGVTEQQLDNSCGLASLRTIMYFHFGDEISERGLFEKYISTQSTEKLMLAMQQGLSFLELEDLLHMYGYQTRRSMFTLAELREVVTFAPVLVYLEVNDFRHFAVIRGMSDTEVLLADSSRGNVRYSLNAFLQEWKVPDEVQTTWQHPGGLLLFKVNGTSTINSRLLVSLEPKIPGSLHSLRRTMMFGQ